LVQIADFNIVLESRPPGTFGWIIDARDKDAEDGPVRVPAWISQLIDGRVFQKGITALDAEIRTLLFLRLEPGLGTGETGDHRQNDGLAEKSFHRSPLLPL